MAVRCITTVLRTQKMRDETLERLNRTRRTYVVHGWVESTKGRPSCAKNSSCVTSVTTNIHSNHGHLVHAGEANVLEVRFTSGSGKKIRTRTQNLTAFLDGSERERNLAFGSGSGTLRSVRVRFGFEL